MTTNGEKIRGYSTHELAVTLAGFLHSGKLNPDVDYESSITWVKIIKWLEEPADEPREREWIW